MGDGSWELEYHLDLDLIVCLHEMANRSIGLNLTFVSYNCQSRYLNRKEHFLIDN